jgi:hypothetical protein
MAWLTWNWKTITEGHYETFATWYNKGDFREIVKIVAKLEGGNIKVWVNGSIRCRIQTDDISVIERDLQLDGYRPCGVAEPVEWREINDTTIIALVGSLVTLFTGPVTVARFIGDVFYLDTPKKIYRFSAENWQDAKDMAAVLLTEERN